MRLYFYNTVYQQFTFIYLLRYCRSICNKSANETEFRTSKQYFFFIWDVSKVPKQQSKVLLVSNHIILHREDQVSQSAVHWVIIKVLLREELLMHKASERLFTLSENFLHNNAYISDYNILHCISQYLAFLNDTQWFYEANILSDFRLFFYIKFKIAHCGCLFYIYF